MGTVVLRLSLWLVWRIGACVRIRRRSDLSGTVRPSDFILLGIYGFYGIESRYFVVGGFVSSCFVTLRVIFRGFRATGIRRCVLSSLWCLWSVDGDVLITRLSNLYLFVLKISNFSL